MKYYIVKFVIAPPDEALLDDVRDVLAALAGECGFETFEESPQGLNGYIQQPLLNTATLDSSLQNLPFEGVNVSYTVSEAEERDWNEQWEQEGFAPIVVGQGVVIHDGRHLPEGLALDAGEVTAVEIDAHMAFGTGNHATTRLMVQALLDCHPEDKDVLDCGTGTGILAIVALKRGARKAVGYDVDEWSVDNARHNAVINGVADRMTVVPGNVSVLDHVEGTFQVIMANINRNILLADMAAMAGKMAPKGHLLLSGFYQADVPLLKERAATLGLTLTSARQEEEWACLTFEFMSF